jgi:hypothetical protein
MSPPGGQGSAHLVPAASIARYTQCISVYWIGRCMYGWIKFCPDSEEAVVSTSVLNMWRDAFIHSFIHSAHNH